MYSVLTPFTVSPNGLIYAKQHLRRSLLAKMLSEILNTRVMIKQGMKTAKGDKVRILWVFVTRRSQDFSLYFRF